MQTLIFGLAYGSIYALMALAINIVNSTTRTMNFAHAGAIMVGAMTSYWCIGIYGFPYIAGLLVGIAACAVLNILVYFFCMAGLGDLTKNSNWIITMFGMSVLIENTARMVFGTQANYYPYLFNGARIHIFGANILWHELFMIVIAIVIGVAYQTMCSKTKFGRALRAVSYKPNAAMLMGIDSRGIRVACFAMAGAVAALAGAMIAPYTYASYTMTASIGLKGFAATLIGGIGNTKGAFVGGIILGLIDALMGMFVSASIRDAFSFVIMILVIIFMPGGVMSAKIFTKGRSTAEKV